jgi:hypothetical protein
MKPIMCAYKIVRVRFEVWGFQTRVEDFAQRVSQRSYLFNLNDFIDQCFFD